MTRVIMAAVPWEQPRVKNVKVIKDQVPDLEVVWDERRNAYDTFTRALQAAGSDPAVFLEDDIVLTQDWRLKVEDEIRLRPNDVIQFFSMRKADVEVGSRWESGRTFIGNLCWYAPAGLAADLVLHMPRWQPHVDGVHPTGYDLAMADFFKERRLRYWVVVPNLVDHMPGPSAINPRRPPRVSRSFQP